MYKGILFASDGEWVTDFERETKEEVVKALADRGSRWFFYPFEGVIKSGARRIGGRRMCVDMAPPLESLKGKSVMTVSEYIKAHAEELLSAVC